MLRLPDRDSETIRDHVGHLGCGQMSIVCCPPVLKRIFRPEECSSYHLGVRAREITPC